MSETRILVVEDDAKIASLLADYARAEGYVAEAEANGTRALQRIKSAPPAALILDLMLPGLDGVALCRAVRQFSAIPILMLTARIDEIDRLLGLNAGADDYICKPFSPREVMARLRAQLRRASGALEHAARGLFSVDESSQRIIWCSHTVPLTKVEYRLLAQLLKRPGTVFGRAQLLDLLHDDFRDVHDRVIDTHIKNIRRKIAAIDPGRDVITSVYGVGYRFDLPDR